MTQPTPVIVHGCLHIHTTCSDGSGTVPEVIAAGQQTGLEWMIVTDHDTLDGKPFEGWHDDLLVLVSHEVTPLYNHFLALDVDEVIRKDQPARQYIAETYAQGGFGVLAHPDDHLDDRDKGIHPWQDWSLDGPIAQAGETIGLELWNFMSDWRARESQYTRQTMWEKPEQVLCGPTANLIGWWDELNRAGRHAVGIGGLDAHATRQYRFPLMKPVELFPYAWMFGAITNYLLLDAPLSADAATARKQVYGALRQGRSYLVNRLDGTAPELPFVARRGAEAWHCGDTVSLAGGALTLELDGGEGTTLRLIHNGELIATTGGSHEMTVDQPGFYRLEGYRNNRPWLYTNPLYVIAP